jgi:Flp pilus assembly protein TadD
MKPDEPDILNNQGWSLILRGKWMEAINPLEQASILDPKSTRIQNNLELARAAIADRLPERKAGETDSAFAARLNDAGVAAEERGDRARAVAAFSQALAAKDSWYARAANNLEKVQTP